MKAIRVRHLPATDRLPRRYKADDGDHKRFTMHVDESETGNCFRKAAAALCAEMGWRGRLIEGGYGFDRFFVFDPLHPSDDPARDYFQHPENS